MKKIILSTVIILITQLIFAQNTSSLTIFSEDNQGFYLFLNGIRQNQKPEINITVDYLEKDYYDTKIVFANKSIPSIKKSFLNVISQDEKKGNVTYKIKKNRKGKLILRYYSFTPFKDYKPATENVTIIHHNSAPMPNIDYSITTTQTTTTSSNGEHIDVGVNIGGVNMGMNVNINDNLGNVTTQTTTTTTTTTSGNLISNDLSSTNEVDCYTLNNADYRQALESIKSKSFSETKLSLAKQIVKRNCLTATQIKKITALFTFEDTKLTFAKYAYPFCYNPENYWKLSDVFTFESSMEELNEFIDSQR